MCSDALQPAEILLRLSKNVVELITGKVFSPMMEGTGKQHVAGTAA